MPTLSRHYAVGVGFRLGTTASEIITLIDQGLTAMGITAADIEWLASLADKTEQPQFTALLEHYGWQACALTPSELDRQPPSAGRAARIHKGVTGVAEQAAQAALHRQGMTTTKLLLPKHCSAGATFAIAQTTLATATPDMQTATG